MPAASAQAESFKTSAPELQILVPAEVEELSSINIGLQGQSILIEASIVTRDPLSCRHIKGLVTALV